MRPILIVLAVAGGIASPAAFAQSVQPAQARASTTTSQDSTTASSNTVHRAMASFDSLLREAALQSQAAQRAPAPSPPVVQPTRPATNAGGALASTPEPGTVD